MYANLYIFSLRQSLLYLFRKVMSWLQITLQVLFSTRSHKEKWWGHNVVFCFRPLYLFTRSCLFKTLCHAKCTRQHGWYRGQRIVCHVLGYTMILWVRNLLYTFYENVFDSGTLIPASVLQIISSTGSLFYR